MMSSERGGYICEGCERPIANQVCSGLDVPPLYFCDDCMPGHIEDCEDIKSGRSWVSRVGALEGS